MLIQLYHNDSEMLGSDGYMHVDGRYNKQSIINAVRRRNGQYKDNFPFKIANGYSVLSRDARRPCARIIDIPEPLY